MRELAISREKLEWDIDSRERGAEKRGREKGQSEAQRMIARNLLRLEMSLAEIAQVTGLSLVELQALQAEGRTRH
jgi:predicted transposase/invertase (TIGR01784 family)